MPTATKDKEDKALLKRGEWLFNKAPATTRANWLPEGLFPELDEMHAKHSGALEKAEQATMSAQALREQYEAEDKAKELALRNGNEPPKVTPDSEREVALNEARARAVAARNAVYVCIAEAEALIQGHEDEWLGELRRREVAAESKCEQLRREIEQIRNEVHASTRGKGWIKRTAEGRDVRHMAYEDLAGKPRRAAAQIDLNMLLGRE